MGVKGNSNQGNDNTTSDGVYDLKKDSIENFSSALINEQPKQNIEPPVISPKQDNVVKQEIPTPVVKDNLPPLEQTNTMPEVSRQVSYNQKPPIIPQPFEQKNVVESPVVQQPEVSKIQTPADNVILSSVRTYKADLNETVNTDKITTAKILIAEQKKQEKIKARKDKNSIENPVNKFKLALSIILIGLAVVAILYGTFIYILPNINREENNNQNVVEVEKIIEINEAVSLDTTNRLKEDVLVDVQNFFSKTFKENSVNELVLYEINFDEESGQTKTNKLSISNLFRLFGFNPPYVFDRNLSDDYLLGSFYLNSENKKFLLIKLSDFENTYNSIFDYEKDLVFDFKNIFGGFEEFDLLQLAREELVNLQKNETENTEEVKEETSAVEKVTDTESPSEEKAVSKDSSTETKEEGVEEKEVLETVERTKEVIEKEIAEYQNKVNLYSRFIDVILQNTDSRAVVNKNSEILFFYAFIDKEWLLISDDVDTLTEIKRKIRERNLVR